MGLSICDPPRVRTQDTYEPTKITGIWGNGVGGGGTFVKENTGSVGNSKIMKDYPHPGFHRRLRAGDIVMGDLILYVSERSYANGSIYSGIVPDTGGYWSNAEGDFSALVERSSSITDPPNGGDLVTMGQIALAEAYARMNQSSLLSGEILNDLDSTVGMLRRPFEKSRTLLGKIYKARKRHLGKTAKSAAQATSNAWLEYRYGWKPILLDCETVVDQAQLLRRKVGLQHLVARAGGQSVNSSTKSFVRQPMAVEPAWLASGSLNRTIEQRVGAGVLYDSVSRTTAEQLNKMLGTRPSDLVATVWETIPYSFVADWFVNIGSWLQAVTPNPYVKVRASWLTTITTRTDNYSGGLIEQNYVRPNKPVYVAQGSWGASLITETTVRRDCNPSLTSHPVLTQDSLSVLRQADAMSLSLGPILDMMRKLKH